MGHPRTRFGARVRTPALAVARAARREQRVGLAATARLPPASRAVTRIVLFALPPWLVRGRAFVLSDQRLQLVFVQLDSALPL